MKKPGITRSLSKYFRDLAKKSWEKRKVTQDSEYFSRIGKLGAKAHHKDIKYVSEGDGDAS